MLFLGRFYDSGCTLRTFFLRWTDGPGYGVHRDLPEGNGGRFVGISPAITLKGGSPSVLMYPDDPLNFIEI